MIREKINSELADRSWSVRRLADETGIRYASLTEYLSNKRELSSKNLEIVFTTLEFVIMKTEIKFSHDLPLEYAYVSAAYMGNHIMFFANKPDLVATKKANTETGYTQNPFDGTTGNYFPVIFKTLTKEINLNDAEKEWYWIPGINHHARSFKFDGDKVVCNVEKWENNEGWTDEMLQNEAEKHWKNNISFSIRNYQTRVD